MGRQEAGANTARLTKYKSHNIRVRLRGVMLALDARYAGFDSQNPDQVSFIRCRGSIAP